MPWPISGAPCSSRQLDGHQEDSVVSEDLVLWPVVHRATARQKPPQGGARAAPPLDNPLEDLIDKQQHQRDAAEQEQD